MQRSPRELDDLLPMYIEKIAQLPNVLRVKEPSFWALHSMFFVASLRLEVHHTVSRADKDALIWAVKEILAERGFRRTTVEVEDVINFDRLPSV
ncbi:zinc transporter 7-like [Paramacrobiotus metropolitanus]|uniref:zinc transporter 7-like n=1 Tax=Paramacrobiotus metropolitanus TaxID=2943436 RepID=UPI0024460DA1|nr:zinc transporter 7-like [Paramacrobiotus metropolitanus]